MGKVRISYVNLKKDQIEPSDHNQGEEKLNVVVTEETAPEAKVVIGAEKISTETDYDLVSAHRNQDYEKIFYLFAKSTKK